MENSCVLILSEDFPPKTGGIAQWAAGVATSLHELGYRVIVVTRRWKELPEHAPGTYNFNLRYVYGNHWKKLRTWYWRRALARLYAEGVRPRLMIATTWNAARGVLSIAHRHGTRTIVAVMGLEVTRSMNALKKWWCRQTLRRAHAIIAISEFSRTRVVSGYDIPGKKIMVLPCGVDTDRFRPGIDASGLRDRLGLHDRTILLTLARIIERKGQDQVIRALPAIIAKVPNVIYIIAGDPAGDHPQTLKTMVSELQLENHVQFVGYVETAELPFFYNLCDAYVMPSREIATSGDTEGFGITFLEANACEKPVIGGNSGGVVDAVVDGKTGFLVDPLDPAAIAEKAILLLTDQALAKKMGRQGRERIIRGFTWKAVSERLILAVSSQSME